MRTSANRMRIDYERIPFPSMREGRGLTPALFALTIITLHSSCSRPTNPALAITHVTVIDATGSPPKPDMTLLIAGERIATLGPSGSTAIPRGARSLDATGKFLIPGLADMHVHLTGAGEPAGSREFILPLLLANGVTTVRDMGGNVEDVLRLRNEVTSGIRPGPQIFFTGPYLDGDPPAYQPSIVVKTAGEARAAVDRLAIEGVDFIKTQSRLNREAYFAIAEESKLLHIRFAGHVPDRVSALEASQAGQASIEHLTGILLACSSKEEELRRARFAPDPRNETPAQAHARDREWRRKLLDTYTTLKAKPLFEAFVMYGTCQVHTFPIMLHHGFVTPRTELSRDPRMQYVPQNVRRVWVRGLHAQLENYSEPDFALREEIVNRSLQIVGKMQAAGVRVMAGTDIAAPNVFPGSSLHDDLSFLVKADLSPMQALQAATRNPAEFLGKLQKQGTIEQGKFADLLLLDADPLTDIGNTKKIRALILRGELLNRPALDRLLVSAEK